MRRLLFVALAAGLVTASCSSRSEGLIPPGTTADSVTAPASGTSAVTPIAAVPAGFAATATRAIRVAHANDLGNVARSQSVTVRLVLALRNVDQLHALIAAHRTVSRAAFVSQFAPQRSDVENVTSFLHSQGFTQIVAEPNNLVVSATTTALKAQTAFHTQLHAFDQNGRSVYANVTPAFVPKALENHVVAVLGLNDLQAFVVRPPYHRVATIRPMVAKPQATASPSPCSLYGLEIIGLPSPAPEPAPQVGCLRNYYPADYWRAYDVGSVATARSINVAIVVEGNVSQSVSDLRVNEQHDGLAQVPVVVKQVGLASSDTSGDDEWTLDMTASSGMAGAVKSIYLYDTTSLTDSDLTLAYSKWVSDDVAPVGNSSFGGCEAFSYLDGSMVAIDELLNEAAAQGQTMFASSGDTGSFCEVGAGENGVPAGAPMVEYPAASPYAVGVGGTTLVTMSDGSYQGETPWYSGGGGLSQFEYSPTWQSGVQPEGGSMRGVPDIAMDGDLQTGMNLYLSDQGGWTVIGGTSLASPLAAGAWARMLQAHGKSLGFAAPSLYGNYAKATAGTASVGPPPTRPYGGFHDILAGANGTYTALPGYDYTTGLGSIDVTQLGEQL
jgi:pseudomonalisin